jgi:hypothetical protein
VWSDLGAPSRFQVVTHKKIVAPKVFFLYIVYAVDANAGMTTGSEESRS